MRFLDDCVAHDPQQAHLPRDLHAGLRQLRQRNDISPRMVMDRLVERDDLLERED